MKFSSFLLLLLFFFVVINANEQYHLGIINHRVQWHIHCPEKNTQVINPPLNDQPLISYQCPSSSFPIEITPSEIDLTLICRSESRLIWIIVDVYQYTDWLWSKNTELLNISIKLNDALLLNHSKIETNYYRNRFITINAFYIPFELLTSLSAQMIEMFIRINQCRLEIKENFTWNDIIERNCHSMQSKTLQVHRAQCDFFPKLFPINHSEENTTNIPDFHVILSIDEKQRTVESTTTIAPSSDYYLLFNEHYQHILSSLAVLARASNLLTYTFIFTLIIFIVLIIFFLYTLCYHYHSRSRRKASLLI